VIVQSAPPVVRVAVAAVLDVTAGVARESPEHDAPLTENKVDATSELHSVLVPVSVSRGVVLALPEVGEMLSVDVATVIPVLIESVASLIVAVPVLTPVLIVTVSCVLDELE